MLRKSLTKNFRHFVNGIHNKLSIHLGDDKPKTIFFSRKKSQPELSISYGDYSLKQHNTVEYLGCHLDPNLNGESMARRVLKKINTKLNFFWNKATIRIIRLDDCSVMLLYNHTFFVYGCTWWYPLLSKVLKTKLQIAQNKCILFC